MRDSDLWNCLSHNYLKYQEVFSVLCFASIKRVFGFGENYSRQHEIKNTVIDLRISCELLTAVIYKLPKDLYRVKEKCKAKL
jgi:hypothetical protein